MVFSCSLFYIANLIFLSRFIIWSCCV